MRNKYVFLDDDGNVKSTLKTKGVFEETDKVLKVDNCDDYIRKKLVGDEWQDVQSPAKETISLATLTDERFKQLVLERLGYTVK